VMVAPSSSSFIPATRQVVKFTVHASGSPVAGSDARHRPLSPLPLSWLTSDAC
jgi:hypothetical protein